MLDGGFPRDKAGKPMDMVYEFLELLDERGDRRPAKEILEKVKNLREEASQIFKEHGLIP